MSGDDDRLPVSTPERSAEPRDDRTGWERERPPAMCSCARRRVVEVRGLCSYCLHGLVLK